ncbi:MAG: hypothetical protein M3044_02060 [Thermoproteota archaeon]|nr:hypothetical protein [Thermoproteota archaeon]
MVYEINEINEINAIVILERSTCEYADLQNPKLPWDDLQNWLKYPATGRRRHGSEYLLYMNVIDNEG